MPAPAETPVGLAALRARFGLRVPPPAVTSVVGPGARKTVVADGRITERFPPAYRPDDGVAGHLKFALKHEPADLGVLAALFSA